MSFQRHGNGLVLLLLLILSLYSSEGAITQKSFMVYHDKGMTGATVISKVKLLSLNTTCASRCLATASCCSYDEDGVVCTLLTCPTSVVRMAGFSFIAVDDLYAKMGFKAYQSDKIFKVITGTYHWTDCKTLCQQALGWGTLFIPRSAADLNWIEYTALTMTPTNLLFIGLYSNANLVFQWLDGSAYTGVGGRAIVGQNANEMGCARTAGNMDFYMFNPTNVQCSCLCQALLP